MKKVIFCEIAWMKYYNGVTEEDRPQNGGSYIEENGEGGEVYNFSPYNHKLYGYVRHQGDELHIERYGMDYKNAAEIEDITVVWVASDGDSCKIVGWYEHATMYRYWKSFVNSDLYGQGGRYYNFLAKEENGYLIPEEKRTFVVPRASKAGKGRGMGQSQIWYADSSYAKEEFIPQVLEYFETIKKETIPFFCTKEEIAKCAEDTGMSTQELIDKCAEMYGNGEYFIDIIPYLNLAVKKDDCFQTRSVRGDYFARIGMYDEAEEDFKQALYYKEDMDVIMQLVYIEAMLGNTFLAIELGEKIRKHKNEIAFEEWPGNALNLAALYIDEGEYDAAEKLMEECKAEGRASGYEWIEELEEIIKEKRSR